MRLARGSFIATLVAFLSACGRDTPTTVSSSAMRPDAMLPPASAPAISDGAHTPGNSGFFLLPPIVANPAFTGVFDPNLSPEVQICRFGVSGCDGAPIAVYTTTTGPGSETVRTDATSQHYIVNWNTNAFSIADGSTYRIGVFLGAALLGYADVQIFPTAKAAKGAQSNEYVNLVDGRTLPIKFRIEQGMVTTVTVSPNPATVIRGKSLPLTATLTDAHGNVVTGPSVTWSSGGSQIATVDANGVVTGVAIGSTSVSATANGYPGSAQVIVIPPPVVSLTVTPSSATVIVSKTRQLTAEVKDADGNILTDRLVTWASSDPGIATVDAHGLVTAVSPGNVTITATCEGISSSADITVILPPVASVEVTPDPASVLTGGTVQLTATVRDADHKILTGRVVTWSSADGSIATVNTAGLVAGVQVGSVTITATSEGISDNAQVNVAAAGLTLALGSISAGYTSSCGLTADGWAYCWGGGGTNRPFALNWGFRLTQIAVSMFVKCGLAEDGTAYCQGAYTSGFYPASTTPTAVPAPVKFVHLTDHGGGGPTCGLATDGTAWCWGYYDSYGSQPVQISSTLIFESLSGGNANFCGLTANHELWCWGYALWGPLTPTRIITEHQFKYVAVDGNTGCGLDFNNYVWCWGDNANGEFGDGTSGDYVGWLHQARLGANGMRFASIRFGAGKACGIALDDGVAYCWGAAYIGDGTGNASLVPKRITSPEPLVEVIPGQVYHVCGLTQAGAVYCWGYNVEGQVGDGTFTTPRLTPVRVVPPIP